MGATLIVDDGYDSPESAILRCRPDGAVLLGRLHFDCLSMSGDGKSQEEDLPG